MAPYGNQTADPEGAARLMKRAHRKTHIWLWLGLTPLIAGILYLALELRPPEPQNAELPDVLTLGDD